jgi:hypothetical protein
MCTFEDYLSAALERVNILDRRQAEQEQKELKKRMSRIHRQWQAVVQAQKSFIPEVLHPFVNWVDPEIAAATLTEVEHSVVNWVEIAAPNCVKTVVQFNTMFDKEMDCRLPCALFMIMLDGVPNVPNGIDFDDEDGVYRVYYNDKYRIDVDGLQFDFEYAMARAHQMHNKFEALQAEADQLNAKLIASRVFRPALLYQLDVTVADAPDEGELDFLSVYQLIQRFPWLSQHKEALHEQTFEMVLTTGLVCTKIYPSAE